MNMQQLKNEIRAAQHSCQILKTKKDVEIGGNLIEVSEFLSALSHVINHVDAAAKELNDEKSTLKNIAEIPENTIGQNR